MKCEIRVSFLLLLLYSLPPSGIFLRSGKRFVFFREIRLSLSLSLLPELNFPPLKIEDGSVEDKKFFDRTSLKMIDIIRRIRIIIESILLYFTKVSSVVKICFLFFFGIKMNDKIGDAMNYTMEFRDHI